MSTENEKAGVKQIFENALEAVPLRVHVTSDPNFDGELSLMERSRHYFESEMKRYMMLVQKGVIIFSSRVGDMSLENTSLLAEMAEFDPYVVSWSNVVDYLAPHEFHTMARQISGEDTMHYFHSINWCTRVFGVDVYDHHQEARLQVLAAGLVLVEHTCLMLAGFVS